MVSIIIISVAMFVKINIAFTTCNVSNAELNFFCDNFSPANIERRPLKQYSMTETGFHGIRESVNKSVFFH